jgi:hypothetical protein
MRLYKDWDTYEQMVNTFAENAKAYWWLWGSLEMTMLRLWQGRDAIDQAEQVRQDRVSRVIMKQQPPPARCGLSTYPSSSSSSASLRSRPSCPG